LIELFPEAAGAFCFMFQEDGSYGDSTAGDPRRPPCPAVAPDDPFADAGCGVLQRDVCRTLSLVTAAGRPDDPHTVRLACKLKGSA
jgi:hypothetical protein